MNDAPPDGPPAPPWHPTEQFPRVEEVEEEKPDYRGRAPAWLALVFIGGITIGAVAALAGTVIIPLLFGVDPVNDSPALSTLGDVVLLGLGAIAGALGTGGGKA